MANTAVTLPSTLKWPLQSQEVLNGWNTKFTIPYTQVNTGTTSTDTVTVTLGSTPATWKINQALVNVTTAFAGTTAFTITVGTTSSTSAFVTSQSTLAVAALGQNSALPTLANATGTTSLSLVAIFTNATGGSPGALTAGSLDIYLNIDSTAAGNLG